MDSTPFAAYPTTLSISTEVRATLSSGSIIVLAAPVKVAHCPSPPTGLWRI
jgi:hypothetical protein